MKHLKKVLSMALAAVMALSMTACGNGEKEDAEHTINLWHLWTEDSNAMKTATEEAAGQYMKEHKDVKINIQSLENEAYKTKIATEFTGDAKGIDLFFYSGLGGAKKMIDSGKLLVLDDYIKEDVKEKLKEGSTANLEIDGKLYGLPMYSWMMILYCNNELLEDAGAKVPATYDEFKNACQKLLDNGMEVPFSMGVQDSWQAAFVYEALANREVGAKNVQKMYHGATGFTDKGFLRAAEQTHELFQLGTLGKSPLEIDNSSADSLFLTGKSAFHLQGNWFTEKIYVDEDSKVGGAGTVTAVNIPMSSTGGAGRETDYCGGYIDTFFVNKNTANPDLVMDFYIELSQKLAVVRHESGQGFTAWDLPVDNSKLQPVAQQIAEISESCLDGVLAWDTVLDENATAVHLEAVQALFTDAGDPETCVRAHQEVIKQKS